MNRLVRAIRSLLARPAAPAARRSTFRPSLEGLEHRWAPASTTTLFIDPNVGLAHGAVQTPSTQFIDPVAGLAHGTPQGPSTQFIDPVSAL
jgi:hypothetical protein